MQQVAGIDERVVPHTAESIETLVAYDVFTLRRRDWIKGRTATCAWTLSVSG